MNLLDGRNFIGIVLERGKTEGDADTIMFSAGRFRSSACDRYEYGDGPYTATAAGDTVSFEARTDSPKYGSLLWPGGGERGRLEARTETRKYGALLGRGVVRAPRLDGTLTMVRDGKTLGEKWV